MLNSSQLFSIAVLKLDSTKFLVWKLGTPFRLLLWIFSTKIWILTRAQLWYLKHPLGLGWLSIENVCMIIECAYELGFWYDIIDIGLKLWTHFWLLLWIFSTKYEFWEEPNYGILNTHWRWVDCLLSMFAW